ncbi:hypothetical protein CPB86DRAFT_778476 [Serendipita vermifera]|nr:hypothetical protein CPB86DRAFT_778476 [Serendipita vermifera]
MSDDQKEWRNELAHSRNILQDKISEILSRLVRPSVARRGEQEEEGQIINGLILPAQQRSDASTQTEASTSTAIANSLSNGLSDQGVTNNTGSETHASAVNEETLRAVLAAATAQATTQTSKIRSLETSLVNLRNEVEQLRNQNATLLVDVRRLEASEGNQRALTKQARIDLKRAGDEVEALRGEIYQFHLPTSAIYQSVKDAILREMRGEKPLDPAIFQNTFQAGAVVTERPNKRPRIEASHSSMPQLHPPASSQNEQRRPPLNQQGEIVNPGTTMRPNSMNPPPLNSQTHGNKEVPPPRSERSSSISLPAPQVGYTYVMNSTGPFTQPSLQTRSAAPTPAQAQQPRAPHRRSSSSTTSYTIVPVNFDQQPNQAPNNQMRVIPYQDNRVPVGWTQPSPVRIEMPVQEPMQSPRHSGFPIHHLDPSIQSPVTQSSHPNIASSRSVTLPPGVPSQPPNTHTQHPQTQKPLVSSPNSPMSPADGHPLPDRVVPINYDSPVAQTFLRSLYSLLPNGMASCRICGRTEPLPSVNMSQLFNHSVNMHKATFDAVYVAVTKAPS